MLKHWAVAKISAGGTTSNGAIDEDVCREIVNKLKEVGGGEVSCADVAEKAWSFGRTGLATKVSKSDPILVLGNAHMSFSLLLRSY